MKTVFAALAWCLAAASMPAIGQTPNAAKGCVVFKSETQALARYVEYRSYQEFATNIIVTDCNGEQIRVLSGQNPIFIPFPSGSSPVSTATKSSIKRALQSYPELQRKFDALQKTWTAAARKKPATAPRSSASRKTPIKPGKVQPRKPIGTDLVTIVTIDGVKYENVEIRRADPDGLEVMMESGTTKIPFEKLPPDLREKYKFDPVAAGAFRDATQAARREKERLAEEQKRREESRKATAAAEAAIREKLAPLIRNRAVRIFGTVLRKVDAGVLVSPDKPDSTVQQWPGIEHYNAVLLLKGHPRANEWVEGDRVSLFATPDGPLPKGVFYSYTDQAGARPSVKVFNWVPDPDIPPQKNSSPQ